MTVVKYVIRQLPEVPREKLLKKKLKTFNAEATEQTKLYVYVLFVRETRKISINGPAGTRAGGAAERSAVP